MICKTLKTRIFSWRPHLVLVSALIVAAGCGAVEPSAEYHPKIGQPGKDIVWVPTAEVLTERMLDMAKVTAADYVIDLGSGDGRIVIAAAKRGARALGIEYNPDPVELSKRTSVAAGVSDKVRFVQGDVFETDFSQATVVTIIMGLDVNLRLRPNLLELKPGTHIVTNTYTMGEWQPGEDLSIKRGCIEHCTANLWIVPTRVSGNWKLPRGELTLTQNYQLIFGRLKIEDKNLQITNGILDGDIIYFTAGDHHYTGRVNGNTIIGSDWTASRVGQ